MKPSLSRHPSARSGFTLLELLTVIVIIGILAGILVPVLGRTKDRAHELAAKELCSQVATAWNKLVIDCGRFPSAKLLSDWCSETIVPAGGDIVVPMDPGALSVLDWWTPVSLVPAGDVAKFNPVAINATKVTAGSMANPDPALVEFWPVDMRIERSFVQKVVGFYPPWAEREFKALVDASLSTSSNQEEDNTSISKLKQKWDRWRVRVILDMDGDGIMTLPEDIALLANVGLDEDGKATVRGTAAAWTRSKDGKRLLSSW